MANKYPGAYRFGNWNIICHSQNEWLLYQSAHTLTDILACRRSWGYYNKLSDNRFGNDTEGYQVLDDNHMAGLINIRKELGAAIMAVIAESGLDLRDRFSGLEPIYPE